jgi:hypothetical protein
VTPGSYQLHGLRVRSEIPLRALPASEDDPAGFDLDVVCGPRGPPFSAALAGELLDRHDAGSGIARRRPR